MSLFSKVFLLTQIGLQALVAFLNPNTEGLYTYAPQILLLLGSFRFYFSKKDDPLSFEACTSFLLFPLPF